MFAKSKATDTTGEAQRILAVVRTRAMERRADELWRHAKRILGGEQCSREDCAKSCEAFASVGLTEAEQLELVGFFIRWNGADSTERAKMLKGAAGHPILAAFASAMQRAEAEQRAQDAQAERERARVAELQKIAEAKRAEHAREAALKQEADEATYRERVQRGFAAPIGGAA